MIDIAPTLLSLAGADAEAPLPGRDLTPLFGAEAPSEWEQDVVYEYYWEFNYPHTPTQFAIRNERFKYIRLHGVWDTDALYDLQSDPGETQNLIDDPEYLDVRLDMQNRLHQALADERGQGHIAFTRKFNQGAVFRTTKGQAAADFPERWTRDPGAADRYEHLIPDNPNKSQILERVTKALERGEEN